MMTEDAEARPRPKRRPACSRERAGGRPAGLRRAVRSAPGGLASGREPGGWGRRLAARIDPSDVVQEAQVEALERLDEFAGRRPMPFRVWLFRTAIQRVGKLRRHVSAARRDLGRERPLANPRRSHLVLQSGRSDRGGRSDAQPAGRGARPGEPAPCGARAAARARPRSSSACGRSRDCRTRRPAPAGDRAGRGAEAIRPRLAPPPRLAPGRRLDGVSPVNRHLHRAHHHRLSMPRLTMPASIASLVAQAADEFLEQLVAGRDARRRRVRPAISPGRRRASPGPARAAIAAGPASARTG